MSENETVECGCCGGAGRNEPDRFEDEKRFTSGTIDTPAGPVPVVPAELSRRDRWGFWKVRLGIFRMSYKVRPGLYAVGRPGPGSPVFASANYKASFDRLRQGLAGVDGWILVADTRGINVWCAAGKHTFSAAAIWKAAEEARLASVVSGATLVLPQLSAPGVSARDAEALTGLRAVFGPVRAADIPSFLAAGMTATPEMRRVTFPIGARVALTPMEVLPGLRWGIPVTLALAALGWLRVVPFPGRFLAGFAVAFLAGSVLAPVLLPWIPGRAFSLKGALLGGAWGLLFSLLRGSFAAGTAGWLEAGAAILIFAATAAFLAILFTGSSTFTSMTGVQREMARAVPLMIAAAAAGVALQAAVWLGLGR